MSIAEAKVQRTTAKRLFTMAHNQFKHAIENQYDRSMVQGRFMELREAWGSVMSKNALFLALKYPEDEDIAPEDEDWIGNVAKTFNEAECLFNKREQVPAPTTPNEDETKRAYKLLDFEKSQLELAVHTLSTVTAHEDATIDSINEAQTDMKKQLTKYKEAHRDHIHNFGEIDEKHSAIMGKMQNLCITANIDADKSVKLKKDNQDEKRRTADLKIERMKLPTFSGKIRDYPRFKTDFQKYVAPSIKKGSDAYILKEMCLKEEALELIKNVDDDTNAIWDRLDDRYGKASKLVDVIMYDIKTLKPVSDGEDKKFLELIDCIERSYLELKRVEMESEISNATIVSLIEERLPSTIKAQWFLLVSDHDSKIDETNKFPHLLEFLQKHRRAIEYGSCELRTYKKGKVYFADQQKEVLVAMGDTSTTNDKNKDAKKPYHDKETNEAKRFTHDSDKKDLKKPSANNQVKEAKKKYCWIHQSPNHDVVDCNYYKDQSIQERWSIVREYGACWSCLRVGHLHYDCFNSQKCSKEGCHLYHHPTLHDNDRASIKQAQISQFQSTRSRTCLLQLMRLPAGEKHIQEINVMWDTGATVCLITFKKANELRLVGRKVSIKIIKVGGVQEVVESKVYDVPVRDKSGLIEYFKVYGIQRISSSIESIETEQFAAKFNVPPETIRRPVGEVDVLIGLEYAGFHPEKQLAIDHLVLFSNRFGTCLGGTHHQLTEKTKKLVQEVEVSHLKAANINDFYENESLGVSCNLKCGSCKCGECPIGGKQYTLKQERELSMIEKNLVLKDGVWYV